MTYRLVTIHPITWLHFFIVTCVLTVCWLHATLKSIRTSLSSSSLSSVTDDDDEDDRRTDDTSCHIYSVAVARQKLTNDQLF